jgi:hypothetical protein
MRQYWRRFLANAMPSGRTNDATSVGTREVYALQPGAAVHSDIAHSDTHSDSAHVDANKTHSDTPHGDSHGDVAHSDVPILHTLARGRF